MTLDDVFEEYKDSINSVVKTAKMSLPNVSFVFYENGVDPEEAVYFVSPSMSKIMVGDFPGSLHEMVRDYPANKYSLKYVLAVFPGIVVVNDEPEKKFQVYGAMAFEDQDVRITIDPESLDSVENSAQREAIRTLLSSLRNEYIVQKSMESPQMA